MSLDIDRYNKIYPSMPPELIRNLRALDLGGAKLDRVMMLINKNFIENNLSEVDYAQSQIFKLMTAVMKISKKEARGFSNSFLAELSNIEVGKEDFYKVLASIKKSIDVKNIDTSLSTGNKSSIKPR